MMTETKNEIENAGTKLKASVKATAGKVKNSDEDLEIENVKVSSSPKIPRLDPSSVPRYIRILVPDDNSELSDKALSHAIYLSNATGAEIVILNMVEDIGKIQQTTISGTPAQKETEETRGQVVAADQKDDIQITIEGPAKQMMEERLRLCKEAGAMNQISYKMLTGKKPVEEILDLSYEMRVDLIIMASSKVTSLIPGPTSITRKVIEGAKSPVMVIQFSHF
jgi:nucleotide-binding universal stress UspA family protein